MFLKRLCALGVAASILSPVTSRPHRRLQDAYEVEVSAISLFDIDTQIPDIVAVHNGEPHEHVIGSKFCFVPFLLFICPFCK